MAVIIILNIPEKTLKLLGHQDDDHFRVYTESLESLLDLPD